MRPSSWCWLCPCFLGAMFFAGANPQIGAHSDSDAENLETGKELFTREWLRGDKRSHAGDGLGPVFNARSCAACHNGGGLGGSGAKLANVTLMSALLEPKPKEGAPLTNFFVSAFGLESDPGRQPTRATLALIHPALRTMNSFPLHRFSTRQEYDGWKTEFFNDRSLRGQDANLPSDAKETHTPGEKDDPSTADAKNHLMNRIARLELERSHVRKEMKDFVLVLIKSERNTPALFGVGLIDRIPASVLESVAAEEAREALAAQKADPRRFTGMHGEADISTQDEPRAPLPNSGRIARLKDGRIGKFGWKCQTATLRDFTMQACSSEIGLEVPGFHRAAPPWQKDYQAPGVDMTAYQCDRLIQFVSSLPPPRARKPQTPQHAAEIAKGEKPFHGVGCATCHRPNLGDVAGIYSDLLLHDMGETVADHGQYGSASVVVSGQGEKDQPDPLPVLLSSRKTPKPPTFGAGPGEWRTPPLWGLRDSAPYLHDGRADTIADAVSLHGGEGSAAAQAYFGLTLREREQVELFLESLGAPSGIGGPK